jgi:hypothetical protein
MKKTDIAMLVLVAGLSVGAAFLAVGQIPQLKPPEKPVNVKTIDKYNDAKESMTPDPTVFNGDAINPTIQVTIGTDNGSQQKPKQ